MEVSDFKSRDINHENGLFYDRPKTSEEGHEEALEQCFLTVAGALVFTVDGDLLGSACKTELFSFFSFLSSWWTFLSLFSAKISALIRFPNPIPPPGNFLEDAPTLEDLFISGSFLSDKSSTCSALGAVASTREKNIQCIIKKSIINNIPVSGALRYASPLCLACQWLGSKRKWSLTSMQQVTLIFLTQQVTLHFQPEKTADIVMTPPLVSL